MPGERHTPKLGLDLVGGKQVVFEAKTDNGKNPSKGAMSQARQIMEDRVNGSGVANAEVVVQGGNQIAVSIPGKNSADIAKLGEAAKLNFRPLVMPPVATAAASAAAATQAPPTGATPTTAPSGATTPAAPTTPAGSSPSASSSNSPRDNAARPLDAPSTPASPSGTATSPKASTTPSPSTPP